MSHMYMFYRLPFQYNHHPSHTAAVFGRSQKHFFQYCTKCIRGICDDELYKLMFYLLTYLLTYLQHNDPWSRSAAAAAIKSFYCILNSIHHRNFYDSYPPPQSLLHSFTPGFNSSHNKLLVSTGLWTPFTDSGAFFSNFLWSRFFYLDFFVNILFWFLAVD